MDSKQRDSCVLNRCTNLRLSDQNYSNEAKSLDGGYSWIIVAASFYIQFMTIGFQYAFGVFYVELLEEFGESKAKTSWVGSLLTGITLLIAPITSALIKMIDCRLIAITGGLLVTSVTVCSAFSSSIMSLIVLLGILGGIGCGLLYLPGAVMVGFYFEKKRSLATGIAMCGTGVGAMILPIFSEALIAYYGWRGALIIVAGLFLNCVVAGAVFRPLPDKDRHEELFEKPCPGSNPEYESISICQQCNMYKNTKENFSFVNNNAEKNKLKEISDEALNKTLNQDRHSNGKLSIFQSLWYNVIQCLDVSLLKMPVFNLYMLTTFLTFIGMYVPTTYLPEHAQCYGKTKAALLVSIYGISNTTAKLIVGWITGMKWMHPVVLNSAGLIIGGLATILCPFVSIYSLLATYAVIAGAMLGGFAICNILIPVELIGLESLPSAYGFIMLGAGISTFIGIPVSGWLFDVTGSGDAMFYMIGAFLTLSGLLGIPLRKIKEYRSSKTDGHKLTESDTIIVSGNITTNNNPIKNGSYF